MARCHALLAAYIASAATYSACLLAPASATEPPAPGAQWPSVDIAERFQNFMTKRGFINLTRTVVANRIALSSGFINAEEASAKGGTRISGRKSIPVLLLKFSDTAAEPYPVADLQKELFETWPSGTMTDFYRELSYGQFTVDGTVYPWTAVNQKAGYYEGKIDDNNNPCNGLCSTNRLGELLKEVLDAANKSIDFSQYDNDGPDGIPNSGDDDGYVDFVAFVHPGRGGECGSQDGQVNNNVWSHRYRLSDLTGKDYETKDLAKDGRRIRIDDYVIMPALACDGHKMIQIGVFAHEFGHAFGLPDLYDTKGRPRSQGVGNWDLMGAGSWGGDGRSPHRPSHMAAWSKAFLGWVNPKVLTTDVQNAKLRSIERFPDVLRVNISDDVYYLVEHRSQVGFDDSLTGPGLLLWRINEAIVRIGLLNNSVNADVNNPGVYLVQADGARDLDDIAKNNRGDAGDPFPGSTKKINVDNRTNPATVGKLALCNVSLAADSASLDVRVTDGNCPH